LVDFRPLLQQNIVLYLDTQYYRMFKLQRLEITGFKSFADYTEIVFTGNGITAIVGPNGCGKSNVSDAISWVLGEQRAKSLRGGEMKDVVFAGTKNRKPGGMAEVVLHLVRDDSTDVPDDRELADIDEALNVIDESAVDIDEIEAFGTELEEVILGDDDAASAVTADHESEFEVATVQAAQVGSATIIETKVRSKRHWRPRSFALDFAPGEAVSVTRRLYLSGESDYQLNGRSCRLRDITDLFAGTGLSGAHYAIIEQGRIGQILSAKPADRRNLIEEAAGISKFRARQRAAESRLDSAKSNLGRISDIVSEIDKQVNSLRRQAAKTRRFKLMQEEFRVLLRQLFAAEGRNLSGLSEQLKSELAQAITVEAELSSQVGEMEMAAREATQSARDAEQSLAELRKVHSGNALERDRAERDHIYKTEQVVNLNNRGESLRRDILASEERLRLLNAEFERLQTEDRVEASGLSAADSMLRDAQEIHSTESAALQAIEKDIESLRSRHLQHTNAVERFDEIERQLKFNLEKLELRSDGLITEGERAGRNRTDHEKQASALASSLAEEESKLAEFSAERDQLQALTADSLAQLRSAEARLSTLSDEYSAKRHRLATLNELEEKRAVYAPQVQRIFAEQASIGIRPSGVLADHLNVDQRSERVIEILFSSYLEAVIVGSLGDAKVLSEWVKVNNIGRTAMLIVADTVALSPSKSNPNGATVADRLGAPKAIADALCDVFPREMSAKVVDDLASSDHVAGEMIVDYDGDLLLGGRMFVSGKNRTDGKNASLLAFKRELQDLTKASGKLAAEVENAKAAVDGARSKLVERESKMVDLQSLIIKVDRGIHGLQIQVRSAREEIDRAERHRRVVSEEAAQAVAEISEIQQKLKDAAESKRIADGSRITAASSLEAISTRFNDARRSVEASAEVLNEKRMTAATSGERRRSVQSALRRVENERKEIESRLAWQKLEIADAESKLSALHNELIQVTDRISSSSTSIQEEKDALEAAIAGLAAARERSDAQSEELRLLNHLVSGALKKRGEVEVRQAEAITELKNLAENCEHELNTNLAGLIESSSINYDFDLNAARRQTGDLRQRLDGFGAINMLALDELADAEERLLFLTSQRQDIIDSIAATEEALREIKQRSREKFRTAFEAINENFVEFFQELFGGGRGEMTLLESDDILEAGIEVAAQPPGKRLQNIMLLSGGEKAMTAIALVMAIFKYRPSPFCLLDEVDAPLDEANVGRFVNKIAGMSERTQFIVITHNKRTMEAARALYGVTMQEAGVSKVVSVKFE
jgi:chromosome segregation protein